MKRMGDVMDIVALKRQGLSERQIAKRLGMSRKTVHKYLEDPEICERERRVVVRESKLDPYMGNIKVWLYAAAVMDLYSRRIVGWSMSDTMQAKMVSDALLMALWRRGKPSSLMPV